MTLVIQNADQNLLSMLDAINKMRPQPYTYFQDDDFSDEFIASIREGEAELSQQKANGTLETFSSAKDAFACIVCNTKFSLLLGSKRMPKSFQSKTDKPLSK